MVTATAEHNDDKKYNKSNKIHQKNNQGITMGNKALYLLVPVAFVIGVDLGIHNERTAQMNQLTPKQREIVDKLEHITEVGFKLADENSCRFADDNCQKVERELAPFYFDKISLPKFILNTANRNYELKRRIEEDCIEPVRSKMDPEAYDHSRGDWLYFQSEVLKDNCAGAMSDLKKLKAGYQKDGWTGKSVSGIMSIEKETKKDCFTNNSYKINAYISGLSGKLLREAIANGDPAPEFACEFLIDELKETGSFVAENKKYLPDSFFDMLGKSKKACLGKAAKPYLKPEIRNGFKETIKEIETSLRNQGYKPGINMPFAHNNRKTQNR